MVAFDVVATGAGGFGEAGWVSEADGDSTTGVTAGPGRLLVLEDGVTAGIAAEVGAGIADPVVFGFVVKIDVCLPGEGEEIFRFESPANDGLEPDGA